MIKRGKYGGGLLSPNGLGKGHYRGLIHSKEMCA